VAHLAAALDRRPPSARVTRLLDVGPRATTRAGVAAFTDLVVTTNGIRLALRDEGSGPAVVLCHGFPELAYSWRHQVRPLVAAGFPALAPAQRAYAAPHRPPTT